VIRKGEPWGAPASGRPDLEVAGDDADLARSAVSGAPVPLVGYRPTPGADLARAVGLTPDSPRVTELVVDALRVELLETGSDPAVPRIAVNAVVLGTAPDRLTRWTRRRELEVVINGRSVWSGSATGVVVANGQFLRGADIVPRGHPGDSRIEAQVYALTAGERAEMRRRLATGTHVPHPRILERSGRVVEVGGSSPLPVEVDGVGWEAAERVRVTVLAGALRILV
jgi:hypothetical protein